MAGVSRGSKSCGQRTCGSSSFQRPSPPLWDQWTLNTVTNDGNSAMGQIGGKEQGYLALFPALSSSWGSLGLDACLPTPAPALCLYIRRSASSRPLPSAPGSQMLIYPTHSPEGCPVLGPVRQVFGDPLLLPSPSSPLPSPALGLCASYALNLGPLSGSPLLASLPRTIPSMDGPINSPEVIHLRNPRNL